MEPSTPRDSTSDFVLAVRSISGTPSAAATERITAGWSTPRPLTSRAVPLFSVPSELNQRRTMGVTRTGFPPFSLTPATNVSRFARYVASSVVLSLWASWTRTRSPGRISGWTVAHSRGSDR